MGYGLASVPASRVSASTTRRRYRPADLCKPTSVNDVRYKTSLKHFTKHSQKNEIESISVDNLRYKTSQHFTTDSEKIKFNRYRLIISDIKQHSNILPQISKKIKFNRPLLIISYIKHHSKILLQVKKKTEFNPYRLIISDIKHHSKMLL